MDHPIKMDHVRFRKIIKGRIRKNLGKYISNEKMPVIKGEGVFTIPLPRIENPRFKFDQGRREGIGQGKGEVGDPVNPQQKKDKAGEQEGKKELEVEFSLDELASILAEELELPHIKPKGHNIIKSQVNRYTGIGQSGPDSLKHFKRSYKEALKRQIISNTYDYDNPIIIPHRKDFRYRSMDTKEEYENTAVVIYMMDVSGSMGDEQKEIVRTESFWINLWLENQYKNIHIRYIIHDATAKEVDKDTFFCTRESGGTLISSALKLCRDIIKTDYDFDSWNIYPFHFSDGDNWSTDDTKLCLDILEKDIIPVSNVFCYGQVESRYGSGQFFKDLYNKYGEKNEKVILSKIKNKEAILSSIKDFLGKGK